MLMILSPTIRTWRLIFLMRIIGQLFPEVIRCLLDILEALAIFERKSGPVLAELGREILRLVPEIEVKERGLGLVVHHEKVFRGDIIDHFYAR